MSVRDKEPSINLMEHAYLQMSKHTQWGQASNSVPRSSLARVKFTIEVLVFWLCCISAVFTLELSNFDLALLSDTEYTDVEAIINAASSGRSCVCG